MALYQLSRSVLQIRLGKRLLNQPFLHKKIHKEQEGVLSRADLAAPQQNSHSFLPEHFEPKPTIEHSRLRITAEGTSSECYLTAAYLQQIY